MSGRGRGRGCQKGTDLGDQRRTARLIDVATALAEAPTASLPEALGSPAAQTAAYRFFDNEAIDPDAMRNVSYVMWCRNQIQQHPFTS